ncbi:mucin-2 [Zonotrichia leucophrys gambelii]|uniref:mucin-2 n=1 Tax=Zonotrichia leucophrys gambelii TaxID=257770 RepID=UPI00313FEEDC
MGLRAASLFLLWLALSSASEIRKGRTRSHGHYVCSTWGNNHFKTFDGDVYQFPGLCEYNFVSDCREAYKEFSVHIQRALDSNGHPEIQYILMKIKDIMVYLKPNLVVVDGRIVKTPYYSSGVLIESNEIYTKIYAKLGMVLMWNQQDALMVELDNKFNNHTCGLCGDYNGIQIYNEFIKGDASYNSITYGNMQKISKPNSKCEDPDETQALPSCNEHRDECQKLLTSSAFADCRLRLNLEMYIQACMQDKCACNGKDDSFCLCSTISEYSRQCSHAGGRPGEWRTQSFCPKTCPATMVYRESSSPCMDTCSHLQISSLCEEHYMDGCFCPEGTVYDDISEKGCIPVSQCYCKLGGKSYAPGESISKECEECTCNSGRWTCKDLPCPGTCSVEGGSHFTTFDGKKYTFHGDCYYVLAKGTANESYALLAELAPCGSTDKQTCLKTVVLLVDNKKNVVVFRSDGSVLLNEMTVNVPHVSTSFSVFKPSSNYFVVQTPFGLQMQIQLFRVMQLFVTVDQSVKGKLQGLCGNFNGMEGDDFRTTSGLIEATGSAFANTWKAQSTCADQVEKLEDPCSLSIESANYAEHWCSLLRNPKGPFARCHIAVDPSEYYKKCKYDTCLCEDNEECLCAALSSYSRACAFKGIILGDWRKSVCSNEASSCPGNQVFLYNLTMCQQTCRSLADGEKYCLQDFAPVDGCGCPSNTYLDNQDNCVPISQCPCYYKGSYLEPGEYFTKDGERCVCRNAKIQCTSVKLRMRSETECSSNKTYFDCNAFSKWTSQTPLQLSCHTPQTDHFQTECVSGCVCPEGLFDDGRGGCVEQKDCPCIHNNEWYHSGGKIKVDCNTCTCQKGVWKCTEDVCYGTCMIYGSGHYNTFDGKFYDFDGSCEYVATQDFCGDKNSSGSFSIITENVPCGTTGVTCSKAIKMFLGKTELKLENKEYKEIQRDVGDDVQYWNRTVGLYLVIEASNGVMLIWDKKTTVFIKLSPDYKGKVCGLCGNFDDKANNDFTTRSGLQDNNPLNFGNSWKQSPMCPDVTEEIKPCDLKPHRKSWAEKECSIIQSEVFKICHSKVDPLPYYEACVHDACSCDSGGDCECFCSAVAAYAQECIKAEACVFWRTPDICPIFCDYYNPRNECDWHYEPCGSNITTCRMINNVSTNFTVPLLEGCYPRCPKDKPIYNEDTKQCVTGDQCGCYLEDGTYVPPWQEVPTEENCTTCICVPSGSIECKPVPGCPCVINGTSYEEGATVGVVQDGDTCIRYICAENGSVVPGEVYPCPTSSPTTISTSSPHSTLTTTTTVSTTSHPVTTTPCVVTELICDWTEWFDVSKPEEGGGDYETYDEIRKHGNKICTAPEEIECRAKDKPDVSLEELGQKVECNVKYGLICKNDEQDVTMWPLCYNYEIRVNCCEWQEIPCEHTTTPTIPSTSTTTQTTIASTTTTRTSTEITTPPIDIHSTTSPSPPTPSTPQSTTPPTPPETLTTTTSTPTTTTTTTESTKPTSTTSSTSSPTPTYTTTTPTPGTPSTASPTSEWTTTSTSTETLSSTTTTTSTSSSTTTSSAPTTTTTTVTPTIQTPEPCECIWTDWIDVTYPDGSDRNGGDYETFENIWKKYPSWECAKVENISCRAQKFPSISIADLGQKVECNVNVGLICNNKDQQIGGIIPMPVCLNYEISVCCTPNKPECLPTPSTTSTTTSTASTTTSSVSPPISTTTPTSVETTTTTTTSVPPSSTTTSGSTSETTRTAPVSTTPVSTTSSTSTPTPTYTTTTSPTPGTPPSTPSTASPTEELPTTSPETSSSTTTTPSTSTPATTTTLIGSPTPTSTTSSTSSPPPTYTTSLSTPGAFKHTSTHTKHTTIDNLSLDTGDSHHHHQPSNHNHNHSKNTNGYWIFNDHIKSWKHTSTHTKHTTIDNLSLDTGDSHHHHQPSNHNHNHNKNTNGYWIFNDHIKSWKHTSTHTKHTTIDNLSLDTGDSHHHHSPQPQPHTTRTPRTPPPTPSTPQSTASPSTPETLTTTTASTTMPPSSTTSISTPSTTTVTVSPTPTSTTPGTSTPTPTYTSTTSIPGTESTSTLSTPKSTTTTSPTETPTTTTSPPTTTTGPGSTTTISTPQTPPTKTPSPPETPSTPTPTASETPNITSSTTMPPSSTTSISTHKTTTTTVTGSSTTFSTTSSTPTPIWEWTTTSTSTETLSSTTTTTSTSTSSSTTTSSAPTTTTTTVTPTIQTPEPCECIWTDWIDVTYPDGSDRNGGDYETFENIWKKYPSWECAKVENISCRAQKFPSISIADLGQKVECNVNVGLICNNKDQQIGGIIPMPVCLNYEISVCCTPNKPECLPTPSTTSTTTSTASTTTSSVSPPISTTTPTSVETTTTTTTSVPPSSTTTSGSTSETTRTAPVSTTPVSTTSSTSTPTPTYTTTTSPTPGTPPSTPSTASPTEELPTTSPETSSSTTTTPSTSTPATTTTLIGSPTPTSTTSSTSSPPPTYTTSLSTPGTPPSTLSTPKSTTTTLPPETPTTTTTSPPRTTTTVPGSTTTISTPQSTESTSTLSTPKSTTTTSPTETPTTTTSPPTTTTGPGSTTTISTPQTPSPPTPSTPQSTTSPTSPETLTTTISTPTTTTTTTGSTKPTSTTSSTSSPTPTYTTTTPTPVPPSSTTSTPKSTTTLPPETPTSATSALSTTTTATGSTTPTSTTSSTSSPTPTYTTTTPTPGTPPSTLSTPKSTTSPSTPETLTTTTSPPSTTTTVPTTTTTPENISTRTPNPSAPPTEAIKTPEPETPTTTSIPVTPSVTPLPTTRTTEISTVSIASTTSQQSTSPVSTSPVTATTSEATGTGSTTKTTTSGPTPSSSTSTTLVTETPTQETTTTRTSSPPTGLPTTTSSPGTTTTSGPSSPTATQPPISTTPFTGTGSTTKTTTSGPTPSSSTSTTPVTETPTQETTTSRTSSPPTGLPTTTSSPGTTTTSGPSSPTATQPPISTTPFTGTGSTTKTTTSGPTPSSSTSTTPVTETPTQETTTSRTSSPPTGLPTTTSSPGTTTTSGPSSPTATQPPISTTPFTGTGSTTKTTTSGPTPSSSTSTTPVTETPTQETTTSRTSSPPTGLPTTTSSPGTTTTSGPSSPTATQPPISTTPFTGTGSTTKTTTSGPTPSSSTSTTPVTETPTHETTTTRTSSPPTGLPTTTSSPGTTTTSGPSSPTATQPPISTTPFTGTGSTTKTTTSGPTPSSSTSTTPVTETPTQETTTTRTSSPPTGLPTTTSSPGTTTTSGPSSSTATQPPISTTPFTGTGSTTKTTTSGPTPPVSTPPTTTAGTEISTPTTTSATVTTPTSPTSTSPVSTTTAGTTPTESFTTTSGTTSSSSITINATTTISTTFKTLPPVSTTTSGPTATSTAVTTTGSSTHSATPPVNGSTTGLTPTTPKKTCTIFPNETYEQGDSWMLCNCTKVICIEDNIVQVIPIICNPPPKPTCSNGLSPVPVMDEDGCCWHWECDCYCTGWGDPHYMTFDGLYYSYQGNCTYVLVEEINKKVDNFGVYIDNYHCDARDVVSCPRTLIVRHETQEVRLTTAQPNTLQVEVTVNNQLVALPYKKFGVSIYESGINSVVEIPELKMNVTYNGLSFSIRMPYSLFGNNTQGQCGTCNNNTADDCMLPNGNIVENCETMADHWQVVDPSKPQCSPGLVPTGSPSTTPTQPCKESSICELILGSVFKPCHAFVQPEKYYAACVFDSCVLPNLDLECSSLQIYAATCADQGACIDWRKHTNGVCCKYECPPGKEYRACGPIKETTCKSRGQNETSTKQVEGCFCPNGTMLYDSGVDVCVKTCGCVGVDMVSREFGEKFTVDCKDCICLEGEHGIVCEPHVCDQKKVTCEGEGFYEVTEVNPKDSCCPLFTCKCNTSLCTAKAPKCSLGFEVHSYIPSGQCCPVYQCVPKGVCVHENAEFLPNSSVFVDKCQNCVCTNDVNVSTQLNIISCERVPCNTYCQPGYELKPVKGECCGKCVQTKCIIKTSDNSELILSPGDFKNDPHNNCTIYSCVDVHDQLIASTSEITCPAFNEDSCKPGTISFLPNGCCRTCAPLDSSTPCSVRHRKDFIVYNGCRSVDRVDMTECEGTCGTFSLYSAEANSMDHSCSCCRETSTTEKYVVLKCPGGHAVSHKYIYVESCSCQDTECQRPESNELQNNEVNDKTTALNRIKRAISLTSK